VVHHGKNRGYGGALRTGFETASKDLILYTDGDAQYDPREFALLLDAYSEDIDFVNGYKISRNDPFHRKIIGRGFWRGVFFYPVLLSPVVVALMYWLLEIPFLGARTPPILLQNLNI
jgi:glycosyltransferase involved in cell wall biosynthesis